MVCAAGKLAWAVHDSHISRVFVDFPIEIRLNVLNTYTSLGKIIFISAVPILHKRIRTLNVIQIFSWFQNTTVLMRLYSKPVIIQSGSDRR